MHENIDNMFSLYITTDKNKHCALWLYILPKYFTCIGQ